MSGSRNPAGNHRFILAQTERAWGSEPQRTTSQVTFGPGPASTTPKPTATPPRFWPRPPESCRGSTPRACSDPRPTPLQAQQPQLRAQRQGAQLADAAVKRSLRKRPGVPCC